jgi:HSP20 family protein
MAFPIVFRPSRSFVSMDRLAQDLLRSTAAQTTAPVFAPRLEVVEQESEFLVTAELPGLEESDFQLEVHGNVLTLRGEKRSEQSGEQNGRHFSERVYGAFRRAIELPVEVASEKASAAFKNGVLTVTLPKAETAKVRHIPVNAA